MTDLWLDEFTWVSRRKSRLSKSLAEEAGATPPTRNPPSI